MIQQEDYTARLKAARDALEAMSGPQRYNFRSLVSKRSMLPGLYDYSMAAVVGHNYFSITATPASGQLLPLNIEVRFRVGNPDVLANPNYSSSRFTMPLRHPIASDGVHRLDIRYFTTTAETVYFKVIATGMDDYTLSISAL